MREHRYFVYILASRSHNFYIGVTNSLRRRVFQHKNHSFEGFTERYNIDRLVYYAVYGDIRNAIAREKQLKGWNRAKKIALIEGMNPTWQDLSEGWYDDVVSELKSTADPSTARSPDPQTTRVEEKAGERSAQDDKLLS
ncbi:MAG TPA: GIY-YIG nuclease family protein [Terriglobales bacterium]|nr:GIY-YIG nuclease family protein [Terriglobales bacterium]